MDLYFPDIDTYVFVDPSEFEVVAHPLYSTADLKVLADAADQCDQAGLLSEADVADGLISEAAKYQGRTVTLNKPFRTPNGPKKMSVYVKNDKGNVVKVNFGDPDMKIRKNDPARRKSFRARHKCENPGPKWKAKYWSCRAW